MRLIDADAMIDRLKKWDTKDKTDKALYNFTLNRINEQPTIQPEPHWIPCSERLPEKPNVYTVTDSKGDVVRFVFTGTDSSREYWKRCAKAWMPLPTPYR